MTTREMAAPDKASAAVSVSCLLASFVAETRWTDLPPATIAATEVAVLDWFGSVLAGAHEPPARMVRDVVAGFGRGDEATIFPTGRAGAVAAALANGVAGHILELDDIHKGSTVHGAAPIIPAALAVAEREHASGAAFLLAVALGYEAALRVGEAVNPSHYRFFHPTGTAATFGAAAAAGSLLGLDPRRLLDAIGTAGTTAAGLWEFNTDGAMSKHLHPGKAAFNGILAADLAARGFTGASRILEGDRGFFAAMSDAADPTKVTDGLGTHWKVEENGYKLHACCGHTHTAVDAALSLRGQIDDPDGIVAIRASTYGPGWEIVKEANPGTPYAAKFSLAYVIAAALVEGVVGLEQFSPDRFGPEGVQDRRIAALFPKIQTTVDPALTAAYPAAWPSRLAIDLADGRTLEVVAEYPRGHPEAPAPIAELEAKARNLILPRYGAWFADRVVATVWMLPDSVDMAGTMRELFPAPGGA